MRKKTFPTEAELIIVKILGAAPTPLYGLQIVAKSNGTLPENGVYSLLRRLIDQQTVLITGTETGVSGLARPLYTLSIKGRIIYAALQEIEKLQTPRKLRPGEATAS